MSKARSKTYDASAVKKLGDLEAILKNPGMYVGDNEHHGLFTLWRELIDNSLDEYMAGHGSEITITISKKGEVKVVDNGRGIPIEWKPEVKMSALTLVLTKMHAGGKFDDEDSGGYEGKQKRGLHGAGAKAAVAFAKYFQVEVRRHGLAFRQSYEKVGTPLTPVEICIVDGKSRKKIGEINAETHLVLDKRCIAIALNVGGKKVSVIADPDLGTGTTVEFLPDRALFASTMEWGDTPPWNIEGMEEFLFQMACLNPGLKFVFTVDGKQKTFFSKNGLADYLGKFTTGKTLMHDEPINFHKEIHVDLPDGKATIGMDTVVQYAGDDAPNLHAFANTLYNKDGGTHAKGFRDGWAEALRRLAQQKKRKEDFKTEDLFVGMNAVLSVNGTQRLQFNSQTKAALTSPEFAKAIKDMTLEVMESYFKKPKNQQIGLTIIDAAIAVSHARDELKMARDVAVKKSLLDAGGGIALSKLSDITRRSGQPVIPLELTALYLCEGDSAAGTMKNGRDSRFHAIYALRGKTENIWTKSLKRALEFAEYSAIATAIGAKVGPEFDLDAMRYGRVTITTDADHDGSHIRVLLITFFYKFMRPMIEDGRLFIARPPLFRVRSKKNGEAVYVYSEQERDQESTKFGGIDKVDVQRFKGLGEMNDSQMAETVLWLPPDVRVRKNEAAIQNLNLATITRNEIRVNVDDAKESERTLQLLMGDDAAPRRKWLMSLPWHVEAE